MPVHSQDLIDAVLAYVLACGAEYEFTMLAVTDESLRWDAFLAKVEARSRRDMLLDAIEGYEAATGFDVRDRTLRGAARQVDMQVGAINARLFSKPKQAA